jgi:SPP1 family predicted phage head-tail adaptor
MSAGRLSERIRFEQESRTSDGGGGASVVWTAVATRWAAVEPLKGREQLEAMQLEASNLYRVTIRNDGLVITAAMRLVWLTGGNALLNIRECATPPAGALYRTLVAELGVAL